MIRYLNFINISTNPENEKAYRLFLQHVSAELGYDQTHRELIKRFGIWVSESQYHAMSKLVNEMITMDQRESQGFDPIYRVVFKINNEIVFYTTHEGTSWLDKKLLLKSLNRKFLIHDMMLDEIVAYLTSEDDQNLLKLISKYRENCYE